MSGKVSVRRHVRRRAPRVAGELRVEPAVARVGETRNVYIDGNPVGHFRWERSEIPGVARIEWLEVRSDVRSRGVGRRIAEKILSHLGKKGFEKVELVSVPESVGFWEKVGFVVMDDSDPGGQVLMEADL